MSFFSEIQEKACADYYRPGTVGTPAPPAAKQTEPVRATEPASSVREEASAPKPLPQTPASHAPAKEEVPKPAAADRTASPVPVATAEPMQQLLRRDEDPVSTAPSSGVAAPESSAMPAQSVSKPSAESPQASAADSAHVPPPPEIKLSASSNARAADDDGRRAHEEAEAKRKAEWEARQAAKQAAKKEQMERLAAMSDEDVAAEAIKRIGADTEKLTRRNMKEMICLYVQELCGKDAAFARRAMSPEKSMIHCFQYINRKAREYAEQEMQDNGIERRGTYGCDVPDGLCYQWAEDYFNDPDAKEDQKDEEKFAPKPYMGSASKTSAAKADKKKSEKKSETKKAQDAASGTSGTGRHGEKHYYYMCVNRKRKKKPDGCGKKTARKDVVERIVTDVLYETVNNPAMRMLTGMKVYEYYKRQHGGDENYQLSLENRIKETEKATGNIMKAIEAGIFNEMTQSRMLELQQQKKMLEDELAAEKLRQQYSLKPEHVVKYLESFSGNLGDVEVRRRVLDLLINKIIISDDKVTITFNFSDDQREFDIAEMPRIIETRERIMNLLDSGEDMVHNDKTELIMDSTLSNEAVSEGSDFFV